MSATLVVFLGGGIGATIRYAILRLGTALGLEAAWAILFINLVGALFMGFLLGLSLTRIEMSEQVRLFLLTGLLGGFTTFSTLAADIVRLSERGWSISLVYVIASIVGGLLLLLLGLRFGRTL